jgi:hypothetical protein
MVGLKNDTHAGFFSGTTADLITNTVVLSVWCRAIIVEPVIKAQEPIRVMVRNSV